MKLFRLIMTVGILFTFSQVSLAHEHHHEDKELKSEKPKEDLSLHQLESKWIDESGKQVALKDFKGEPFLLSMAYTRCKASCPLIVDDLLSITEGLPKTEQKIKVVLASFDSNHETPETMKKYREKRKLPANWVLLKSDSDTVIELAAVLGVKFKKLTDGEYIHSNSIFLVSDQGVIVAQKDGLKTKNKTFVGQIVEQLKKSKNMQKTEKTNK